jgi:hypothetical protein
MARSIGQARSRYLAVQQGFESVEIGQAVTMRACRASSMSMARLHDPSH